MKNTSISLSKINLELKIGNIAMLTTDAIVNTANELLNNGVGLSGAIIEARRPFGSQSCLMVRDFPPLRFLQLVPVYFISQ